MKVHRRIVNIKDLEYPIYEFNPFSVTKVIILNKIVPTSCAGWFANCTALTEIINIENLDTSCVTNMSGMFATCGSLSIDVSSFNTSKVADMSYMFGNTINDDFGGCWNVSGLEHFDMRNVVHMQDMFYFDSISYNAEKLNSMLDICIKANKIPSENKTIRYVAGLIQGGYYSNHVNFIQSLSNYQDFINAGWSIN